MNFCVGFEALQEKTIGEVQGIESDYSELQKLEVNGFNFDTSKKTLVKPKSENNNYAENLIEEIKNEREN